MIGQPELAANDIRRGAKFLLPKSVTDNHPGSSAASDVITGIQNPAHHRWHAQYVEEVATHPESFRLTNVAALSKIEAGRSPRKNSGKCLLAISYPFPDRIRDRGITEIETAARALHIRNPHLGQFPRRPHR